MLHDIDAFARQFIRGKAQQLRGRGAVAGLDQEDVESELLLNLLQRRARFDPLRGTWTTFVRLVTDHCAADLVAGWKSSRQNPARWFSTPVEADDSEAVPRTMRRGATFSVGGAEPVVEPEIFQIDRRLDLEEALARLPAEDRRVCQLLPRMTRKELADQLGVSRSTLDRRRLEIGQRLLEVGVQHYLPSARKP